MTRELRRVVIAGGGTGGHLFPGLAVAQVLKRKHRGVEILFLGTRRGLESKLVPREGYALKTLPVRGLPRRLGFELVRAGAGLVASLALLVPFFFRTRPDVVLGTGGYVSAPAICVARLFRVPVVLQEQNAVPGSVNRFLSRFATEVHISFAGSRRFFRRKDNLRLTGNPLRPTLLSGNRQRACAKFRLDPMRKTVLVLGGSRGAKSLSRAVVDGVRKLPPELRIQFLVQCGKQDHAWVAEGLTGAPIPCAVEPFIDNMEDAYALADVIACRAGAMTIAEVSACGIPALLVPYPYATDNHQQRNAEEMVDRGAAVMIHDAELDGDRFALELHGLLADPARLREMATNAHRSAKYDAADRLADAVAQIGRGRPEVEAAEAPPDEPQAPSPGTGRRRRRAGSG